MRLSLFDHRDGVASEPGNRVVYDVERNEAHFGAATVAGRALVWELAAESAAGTLLSVEVALDRTIPWLMRCDRVDFPAHGVAYLHTHPGPGIRCLLAGQIRIEAGDSSATYGPFEAWFERGPEPVLAQAGDSQTAFVRVLLLPREWEGKRTISYVNADDADKPKTQAATVFFDQPIEP